MDKIIRKCLFSLEKGWRPQPGGRNMANLRNISKIDNQGLSRKGV